LSDELVVVVAGVDIFGEGPFGGLHLGVFGVTGVLDVGVVGHDAMLDPLDALRWVVDITGGEGRFPWPVGCGLGDQPPHTREMAPVDGDQKPGYRLSQSVVNAVALVIVAMWAASFLADIFIRAYVPPTQIHLALMVVLGGVFGSQFLQRVG
jgi:hypothetical protein